ncbi:MAG: hypothetical protein DMG78_10920 [Acidobacteria bacterium]|nr:MAG: hypothetical protein DMG78_10920 [Acidobacteriota bacterium]
MALRAHSGRAYCPEENPMICTLPQNVGAAWLMVSLGAGPIYVALTQTPGSLPYFLFALPAGSAVDIFDRRELEEAHS